VIQLSKLVGEEQDPFFMASKSTLPGTNISPTKALLKMIFLSTRWDALVPGRVYIVLKIIIYVYIYNIHGPYLIPHVT